MKKKLFKRSIYIVNFFVAEKPNSHIYRETFNYENIFIIPTELYPKQ